MDEITIQGAGAVTTKKGVLNLEQNISTNQRIFSVVSGGALLLDAIARKKSITQGLAAGYLIFRGATGYCAATDASQKAAPKVKEALDSARTKATEAVDGAKEKMQEGYQKLTIGAKEAIEGYTSQAKGAVDEYTHKAKDAADEYTTKAKDAIDGYTNKVKDTAEEYTTKAKDAVSDYSNKAKETAEEYKTKAKDAVSEYTHQAKDAVAEATDKVKGAASDLAEKAKGVLHLNSAGEKFDINIETKVRVHSNRQEVYDYWRKLENLPKFMEHLESVTQLDKTTSQWKAKVPGGIATIDWKAEIVEDKRLTRISWKSVEGADVENAGTVDFFDAGKQGTDVHVVISYHAPAGKVGNAVAKLLNPAFEAMIEADIKRFAEVMEEGKAEQAHANGQQAK
ncbi:hypothetical protein BH09BAC1_BH09BAC1_01360 [soil metagenome]